MNYLARLAKYQAKYFCILLKGIPRAFRGEQEEAALELLPAHIQEGIDLVVEGLEKLLKLSWLPNWYREACEKQVDYLTHMQGCDDILVSNLLLLSGHYKEWAKFLDLLPGKVDQELLDKIFDACEAQGV